MDTSAIEAKIRSTPLESAVVAIGAGFLLAKVPIFGLLGLAFRVALLLVRPALLILGGLKAWDLYKSRKQASPLAESEIPL